MRHPKDRKDLTPADRREQERAKRAARRAKQAEDRDRDYRTSWDVEPGFAPDGFDGEDQR